MVAADALRAVMPAGRRAGLTAAALGLALAAAGAGASAAQTPRMADARARLLAFARCPDLATVLGSDAPEYRLVGPVLGDAAAVGPVLAVYRRLLACLTGLARAGDLPDDLETVRFLAEYFVVFADPEGDHELVDLATAADPGVVALREGAGIPPPPGLVFVRYYPDRASMPSPIRTAFEREDVRGVTIFDRYVALLADWPGGAGGRLAERVGARTRSHELVHAYVNGTLPFAERSRLPVWFHEGVAIYFSGSGGTESATEIVPSPDGPRYRTHVFRDPRDYAGYRLVFLYLADALGDARLGAAIRASLDERSDLPLLAAAGADSFGELLDRATAWEARSETTKTVVFLGAVVLVVLGVWWWIRTAPEDAEDRRLRRLARLGRAPARASGGEAPAPPPPVASGLPPVVVWKRPMGDSIWRGEVIVSRGGFDLTVWRDDTRVVSERYEDAIVMMHRAMELQEALARGDWPPLPPGPPTVH